MTKYKEYMTSVTYCVYGRADGKATLIVSNVPLTLRDCRIQGYECLTKRLLGRHSRAAQLVATEGTIILGTRQLEAQRVPEALIKHVFDTAIREFGTNFQQALIDTEQDARAHLLVAAAKNTLTHVGTQPKVLARRMPCSV